MSVECSFGAMKEFYARPEVSVNTKYRIFMAIQINLLLWGCEGWALRKDLLLKLQRCVNRKVRGRLGGRLMVVNQYDRCERQSYHT